MKIPCKLPTMFHIITAAPHEKHIHKVFYNISFLRRQQLRHCEERRSEEAIQNIN
ncbi:MAG: hypothetical protein LBC68_01360 [Prevotellaceae bacterium]|nr:hypothetical protein [Prevotellaceae bacterium]